MIQVEDSDVLEVLIKHISEQRRYAKLVDQPFELGIVTDKRPSQIIALVFKNEALFKELGLISFNWYDDALRSSLKLCGEDLLFSICSPRNTNKL